VTQLAIDRPELVQTHDRQRWTVLRAALAVGWLVAVALAAIAALVLRSSQLWSSVATDAGRKTTLIVVAAGLGLLILTACASVRLPAHRRRALMVALALLPAPVLLTTSGTLVPALLAIVMVVPACVVFRVAIGAWLRTATRLESWVIGSALGMGLLAALTFALGSARLVGWRTTVPSAVLLAVLAVVVGRAAVRDDLMRLRDWIASPGALDWAERAQVGLLVGIAWLTLVWMCAPEIMTDAVSVRLANAADVVATGQLLPNPERLIVWKPGLSELVYAYVMTVGSLESTHVVSALLGWICVAGVGAAGLRLGGSGAALPSMTALATFPLMLWIMESASADVFAVLYATAALLVLIGPGFQSWRAVLVVGVCLLLGLAVKASFAIVAVGFVVVTVPAVFGALGGALGRVRARLVAALGLLAIVAVLVVAVVNLAVVSRLLSASGVGGSSWTTLDSQVAVLARYGAGRSLTAFLQMPFDVTFRAGRYGEVGDGAAGYLLLALVPLSLLTRPRRLVWLPLAVTCAAYLAWFFTTQYLRYALPLVVLLAAVGGASACAAMPHTLGPRLRTAFGGGLVLLGILSVGAWVGVIMLFPGEIPWRVSLGLEARDTYIARSRWDYDTLQLLRAEPAVTKVASNRPSLSHLYASAIINPILADGTRGDVLILKDEATLVSYLDREGYSDLIVDRTGCLTDPKGCSISWSTWPWLNEEILQRNTVLVGGAHNVYLYRLLPPDQRGNVASWGAGPELLKNGALEPDEQGKPAGWVSFGSPVYDDTGQSSHGGLASVRAGPAGALAAPVPVTPGTTYLLSEYVRSAAGFGRARLQVNWEDAAGASVGVSIDVVPATDDAYRRWSMLAKAPPTAVRALIFLNGHEAEIWFDDVSFRTQSPS
jgi:hypothetical protein